MFARPLACAFLLLAGATAQIDTVPVLVSSVLETGPVSVSSAQDTAPVTVSSAQDTAPVSSADGFMTVQTSVPSSLATDSESTSACLEVCVVEPCTQCPLTNPLRTTETIPQLTFCDGVYTNTPCASATGQMSIPQGETPEPTSNVAVTSTAAESESSFSSQPSRTSSVSRPVATSSSSGSVPSTTQTSTETPGAAASVFKRDGSFVWVAAISGLSATLGFALVLL